MSATVLRPRPVPDARVRIFLLHHAGGSHLVYRDWRRHFPDDWDVCLVEAPGRGVLADVPPVADIAELTGIVLADLRPLLDRPFVFFGHSMGALLSYELTLRLMAEGAPLPAWLGLSARSGPRPDGEPDPEQRHRLPEAALRREVGEIGGTPADVLADDDLWEMLAPLLRTDLQAVETWRPRPGTPKLTVPISVFGGEHDTVAGPERLAYWRGVASRVLGWHVFDGDHFYFAGREAEVVSLVVTETEQALAEPDKGMGTEMTSAAANGIRRDVRRCVGEILGLEGGAIDPDRPLTELGLEPYTAVRLRHRLREELGVELALADVLSGGCLRSLSAAAGVAPEPAQRLEPVAWSLLRERARAQRVRPTAVLAAALGWTLSRWDLAGTAAMPVSSRSGSALLTLPEHDPLEWHGFADYARAVDERLTAATPVVPGGSHASHAIAFAHDTDPLAADRLRFAAVEEGGGLALRWWFGDAPTDDAPTDDAPTDDALVDDVRTDDVRTGLRASFLRLLRLLAADEDSWRRVDLGWDPSFQLPEPMRARPFGEAGPLLDDPLRRAAGASPTAPAVLCPLGTMTHGELAARADELGAHLASLGAGPGDLVAVMLAKGPEQIAAVLGINRCGAGYVPIDPSWPAARVDAVVRQADLRFAVVPRGHHVPLRNGVRQVRPDDVGRTGVRPQRATPDQLSYAIFTSGSTGTPKGVAIEHRQARTTVDDITERFGIGPHDRVLGLSALSFDLSVYDIFGVLGAGGALVLPEPSGVRDPEHWLELIAEHRVTVWNTAPALMEMLVDFAEADPRTAAAQLSSLRLVMLSGDWIPVTLPGRLRALAPEARVVSLGGATEASIWSIWFPVSEVDPGWRSIPYGRPLSGQFFHILDENGGPCPVGRPGELHIAGDGVARCYLGDPEQTARRFVVHPVLGERLYRTGDLGRWRTDGTIEFLGRADRQVKVQGYRIELGDIESALDRLPRVRQAVASVETAPDGRRVLVAHVVPSTPGAVPDGQFAAELTTDLAERLPGYMVPSRFVVLDALPVTANGKIDHAALASAPEPAPAAAPGDRAWLATTAEEAARRGLRLSLCVSVGSGDVTQALMAAGQWTRELRAQLDAMGVAVTDVVAPGRDVGLVELLVGDQAGDRGR